MKPLVFKQEQIHHTCNYIAASFICQNIQCLVTNSSLRENEVSNHFIFVTAKRLRTEALPCCGKNALNKGYD